MSVERDENGAFLCKWIIEKFTFSWGGLILSSPNFISSKSDYDDLTWRLNINLNEDFLQQGFLCYLESADDEALYSTVSYEISILSSDGSYRRICQKSNVHRRDMSDGLADVSGRAIICGRDIRGLLKENTLTVRCRIWCTEPFEPNQCLLRTRIGTQKITFMKSLPTDQDFEKRLKYSVYYSDVFPVVVEFKWIDEGLQIQIILDGSQQQVVCVVSVLDSTGNSVLSQKDTFCFSYNKRETWTFPPFISKKWLSDNGCIINEALNLWVELEMPNGRTINEVEKIHFGESSTSFAEEMDYFVDRNRDSSTVNTAASSLLSGLLSLYQEQRFCDVTIQTRSSSFPTHKAILCAQSPVFTAMFERDVEEKRTGIVKISNLDDDTVRHMLLFLYSSTLEDLNWDSALKLFSAADQYGISSLKLICKNLMKAKLSVTNVTQALLLSDLHSEDDWKSAVHNFILEKDSEVLNSDMWKEFIKDHTKLAAETMHLIYLQKLKK